MQKIGRLLDHVWQDNFSDSIEVPFGKKFQQVLNSKVKKETMLLSSLQGVARKPEKENI